MKCLISCMWLYALPQHSKELSYYCSSSCSVSLWIKLRALSLATPLATYGLVSSVIKALIEFGTDWQPSPSPTWSRPRAEGDIGPSQARSKPCLEPGSWDLTPNMGQYAGPSSPASRFHQHLHPPHNQSDKLPLISVHINYDIRDARPWDNYYLSDHSGLAKLHSLFNHRSPTEPPPLTVLLKERNSSPRIQRHNFWVH